MTAAAGHGIYPFFYGPIYPLFKAMAMVLDVTASMTDDGKMAAMQTAAKNLVYQLSALAKNDGDVYIPVVPFSKDVNTDSSNRSENWMDFSDWDAANGSCSKSTYTSKLSCVNMNAPAKDTNSPYKDAIVLLPDGLNTQNCRSTRGRTSCATTPRARQTTSRSIRYR